MRGSAAVVAIAAAPARNSRRCRDMVDPFRFYSERSLVGFGCAQAADMKPASVSRRFIR
jgi:hypothetical protein